MEELTIGEVTRIQELENALEALLDAVRYTVDWELNPDLADIIQHASAVLEAE